MFLLAILISLTLEKLLPTLNGLRSLAWFDHYQLWVRSRFEHHEKWQGVPSLLIIVLLPVVGIAALQHFLNELLALLGFLFSVIVLTYCLGPADEHRRVNEYLEAIDNDDPESAERALTAVLQAGGHGHHNAPADEQTRIQRLIETILILTHDRVLAVLFWFVVLGPMGAVLYRLTLALLPPAIDDPNTQTTTSDRREFNHTVTRLHHLLSWIPSHLTAFSYAIMGSFVHALHAWQNRFNEAIAEPLATPAESLPLQTVEQTAPASDALPETHRLLLRIGMAALQFDTRPPQDNTAIRETLGLCGRSLVAWITLLAIMTLAGWAS
ncbi:MAG: regulatory signaling modulator protein AmpE [Gammaproteobacteria bacterium]|nr:regulatory signaling modulator protein AmpE [Gammaproteobacteria bacterium]